ncbi:speriolin-like protein [Ciona intestinalis]
MSSSEFVALSPEYDDLTKENEDLTREIKKLSTERLKSISEHKFTNASREAWFRTHSFENISTDQDAERTFKPIPPDSLDGKKLTDFSFASSLPCKEKQTCLNGGSSTPPEKPFSNALDQLSIDELTSKLGLGVLPKQLPVPSKRLIGEIAFQLDRRILHSIFIHRKRLYGFTVRNIAEKIEEYTKDFASGTVDHEKRNSLVVKRDATMELLRKSAGYNQKYHPTFSEMLVNKFGVLRIDSSLRNGHQELMDPTYLKSAILTTLEPSYTYDALILLDSLVAFANHDGKPLFEW